MAATLGGIGEAFSDRNFRIYSIGSVLSWLSFFIQHVAIAWAAWELTHSTTWLAIIAVLEIAPLLVLMPIGGALADRFDRVRLMLIAYGGAWLHVMALTVLSYTGTLTITALAVLSVIHGSVHSFSVPSGYGLMPRFVAREKLPSAIAVNSAYTQFAIFAGPALAGWIILQYGLTVAFATNVIGYLVYFITIAFLRTPASYVAPKPSGRSVYGDIIDGLRYITGHRGISALLLLMLVGDGLMTAVNQMLSAIAAVLLGHGVEGMSTLLSAAGLGATISALWLAHGGGRLATTGRVLWAFLGTIISAGALMLAGNLFVAAAIMVAFGFAGEARRTATVSILQISVSESQRGRLMGTQFMLQRVAGGVGLLGVGAAAERYGLQASMLTLVVFAFAAWIMAFIMRKRIAAAFASPED